MMSNVSSEISSFKDCPGLLKSWIFNGDFLLRVVLRNHANVKYIGASKSKRKTPVKIISKGIVIVISVGCYCQVELQGERV